MEKYPTKFNIGDHINRIDRNKNEFNLYIRDINFTNSTYECFIGNNDLFYLPFRDEKD